MLNKLSATGLFINLWRAKLFYHFLRLYSSQTCINVSSLCNKQNLAMLFWTQSNFSIIFSSFLIVLISVKWRFIYCDLSCLTSLSDRRLLIRFVDGTKLRGTVSKFEGRAATWRDLDSWKNGGQQLDTSQPHAGQHEGQQHPGLC